MSIRIVTRLVLPFAINHVDFEGITRGHGHWLVWLTNREVGVVQMGSVYDHNYNHRLSYDFDSVSKSLTRVHKLSVDSIGFCSEPKEWTPFGELEVGLQPLKFLVRLDFRKMSTDGLASQMCSIKVESQWYVMVRFTKW